MKFLNPYGKEPAEGHVERTDRGFDVYDAESTRPLGTVLFNGNFDVGEYAAGYLRAAKDMLVEEGEVYAGSGYRR